MDDKREIIIWRLELDKYIQDAFSGHGSARYPGRWNKAGDTVVYCSESLALATLEILVHLAGLDEMLKMPYFKVSATLAHDIGITEINPKAAANISKKWDAPSPPEELKAFGSQWYSEKKTPILKVPSVIVPEEYNFVINVRHPDAKTKIDYGYPAPFKLDSRLGRSRK